MRMRAELKSTGKTTTGFEIPDSVVEGLAAGGHPKVVVTVKGFTFHTSIARMGGRYLLGVSAARRDEAGVRAGDVLDLDIELDTLPRQVDVPDDLAAALAADTAAQHFWETLSYSQKSWHTLQVTSAKKAETRSARVEKSIAMLRQNRVR